MKSFVSLLLVVGLLTPALRANEVTADEIIAKARSFLGPEETLNNVTSVRLSGHLEVIEDVTGTPRRESATIELIFQKPLQHRMTLKLGNRIEATGIDGSSGWLRTEVENGASRPQVNALGLQAIRSLRTSVYENLYFFRSPSVESVEVVGRESVNGRDCVKVIFHYERAVKFVRWFASDTGELLRSETPQGAIVEESTRIEAGGIRLPGHTVSTLTLPDGRIRKVDMVIEQAEVNRAFPETDFAMPLPVRSPAPVR